VLDRTARRNAGPRLVRHDPPAIDSCKAMVLVLSSSANASRQIVHEVHLAHDNGARATEGPNIGFYVRRCL
jgi:hypothetical protein